MYILLSLSVPPAEVDDAAIVQFVRSFRSPSPNREEAECPSEEEEEKAAIEAGRQAKDRRRGITTHSAARKCNRSPDQKKEHLKHRHSKHGIWKGNVISEDGFHNSSFPNQQRQILLWSAWENGSILHRPGLGCVRTKPIKELHAPPASLSLFLASKTLTSRCRHHKRRRIKCAD